MARTSLSMVNSFVDASFSVAKSSSGFPRLLRVFKILLMTGGAFLSGYFPSVTSLSSNSNIWLDFILLASWSSDALSSGT